MARLISKLKRIEYNEPISDDNNYEFLYHLQYALLLALREQRILNTMQHRQAEEKLKQQRCNRAKHILEQGAHP